jgi:putative transposase
MASLSAWMAGRTLDNIFAEGLWRTVKYEDMYLKKYAGLPYLSV